MSRPDRERTMQRSVDAKRKRGERRTDAPEKASRRARRATRRRKSPLRCHPRLASVAPAGRRELPSTSQCDELGARSRYPRSRARGQRGALARSARHGSRGAAQNRRCTCGEVNNVVRSWSEGRALARAARGRRAAGARRVDVRGNQRRARAARAARAGEGSVDWSQIFRRRALVEHWLRNAPHGGLALQRRLASRRALRAAAARGRGGGRSAPRRSGTRPSPDRRQWVRVERMRRRQLGDTCAEHADVE